MTQSRRAGWVSGGLAVLLASCGGGRGEGVALEAEPLVHGTTTAFGYVGYLKESGCTASLIGRRTALTAAHCVTDWQTVTYCYFPCGNVANCKATAVCVPGTARVYPAHSDPNDFEHDVAIVKLSQDFTRLTGITPILIGGPVQEGETVELVGYGCTDLDSQTGGGEQHYGENSIEAVHDDILDYDDTSRAYACPGDSGGPATVLNCEIGIIAGIDRGLDTDFELTRVDGKMGWIQYWSGDSTVHRCLQPACGDGLCQFPETCSCAQDCGPCPPPPACGDGKCNGTENYLSCPEDCVADQCAGGKLDCCGDGICRTGALCRKLGCI